MSGTGLQMTHFISNIMIALLGVTPISIAAQEADADSTCLISKDSGSYIGHDIKIHGWIIIGVHGSGVFNDKCIDC